MNKNYFTRFLSLGIALGSFATVTHAQYPGGVSGSNTVWLKANVGTTLNAGGNVTTWAEQSGAAVTGDFSTHNPGTGGTTQQTPLFVTGGFNFNPYLKFVSTGPNCISSNNLIAGTAILGSTDMTMFQVINLHTTTGTGVWCKWQTSNTNTYRLGDEINTGSNPGEIRLDFRNSGSPLYTNVSVLNQQTIYTGYASSASIGIRLNGTTNVTSTPNITFSPSGTARLSLGNENETGGDPYPTTVDIAEFVLYKRVLTALETNQVESYLAVKYGFTLTQTGTAGNDYTNSVGTVIWNHTANATYANNITGVGRDDTSGLNQKQSLSITNHSMVTMYGSNTYAGVFPALNAANTNDFATDKSYVLFGDNQADTLLSQCSSNGTFKKMARIWKVAVTGTPGSVTLALQKANVPPNITAMLVANDPNFTTGLVNVPLQDNGTQLYADYAFSNNQYFTFGTVPLALNGVVTPVVCFANTGAVTLNPTGGTAPLAYNWSTTPAQTTQNLFGLNPGNYTVTVTQGNGCIVSESYVVTGNATPVFLKVKDTTNTICTTDNGLINVAGIGGTPAYTYSIDGSPFTGQGSFTNLSSGSHTIQMKDANGCTNDTTVTLSRYTYKLDVSDSTANAWCDANGLGGQITVYATGGAEPYSYFWNEYTPGKGPKLTNIAKGDYKVTVTDVYGCSGSATATVIENSCCQVGVPNAFSPNGDGLNDEFKSVTNRAIPRYEMAIFNRWGQRVFYTTKYNEGWNGTHQNNGTQEDVGTYFYRIKYTCEMGNKEVIDQGNVTLIR